MDRGIASLPFAAPPLLDVRGLGVTFDAGGRCVAAVDGVSFRIDVGKTLAIVGESGAGKTLTCRALMGLLPPASTVTGSARFEGEELVGKSEHAFRGLRGSRIAIVFQEPGRSLDPIMTIGRQIAETVRAHESPRLVSTKARALELLSLVQFPAPEHVYSLYPHQLSGGMQQRAVIAMALAGRPRLLIADEATRSLDTSTHAGIVALLKDCQLRLGMSLIVITHDLRLASAIADDVLVMRKGKCVEYGAADWVFRHPHDAYTKALLDAVSIPPAFTADRGCGGDSADNIDFSSQPGQESGLRQVTSQPAAAAPLLRLCAVSQHFSLGGRWPGKSRTICALSDISLDIHPGEALALVGETGSGKTTLVRTLLQEPPPSSGTVEFQGVDLTGSTRRAIRGLRRDIQMIFQDPFGSLDPKWTILAAVEEPLLAVSAVSRSERRRRAEEALDLVGLPHSEYAQRKPRKLSGGECQRVAIARALAARPKLLILDEALSSLDPLTQSSIVDLLQRLRTSLSIALLMISHDLAQVARLCDRVAVLHDGRLCEIGPVSTVFRSPSHPRTTMILDALPIRKRLRAGVSTDYPATNAENGRRHPALRGVLGA